MISEQHRENIKGFPIEQGKAGIGENTFETWKKFVLGQAGNGDSILPFAYKDVTQTKTISDPKGSKSWLNTAALSGNFGFGLGDNDSSSSWWDTLGLSRMQRYMGFGICLVTSAVLFMLSLFYLPLAVLSPAKFAVPYCVASLLIFSSFGFLQGFITYGKHLISRNRLPFTLLFLGTLILTLFSVTRNLGRIVTTISVLSQLVCLIVYVISYVPGGQSGISVMSSAIGSSLRSRLMGN